MFFRQNYDVFHTLWVPSLARLHEILGFLRSDFSNWQY